MYSRIINMILDWMQAHSDRREAARLPEPTHEPSFILAQMVCAELLSLPEFKRTRENAATIKTRRHPHIIMSEYIQTDKCKIVWEWVEIDWTHPLALNGTISASETRHSICWPKCEPFGSEFNKREREMIEAAISRAEMLQAERHKANVSMERQSKAADALANWMGVEA